MWVGAGAISIDIVRVCVDESRAIAAHRPKILRTPHSLLLALNAMWEKRRRARRPGESNREASRLGDVGSKIPGFEHDRQRPFVSKTVPKPRPDDMDC